MITHLSTSSSDTDSTLTELSSIQQEVLGWQLEQDQDGNWTGLPVQTPDTNYKLSDIRYQLLVNIPLLPAISYHNLNISDGLFSQLQLQLVVLLVEADHISHLNVVKREGGREGRTL